MMRGRREDCTDRDTLYRLYVEEQKSTSQVASVLGIPVSRARTFLERAHIPMRPPGDAFRLCVMEGRRRPTGRKGAENAAWKGGRRVTSGGYVELRLPDHPRARANGYVFEHIVVWEDHNGPLPPGWHIHHINGDKQNNDISNLSGIPSQEHMRYIAMQQGKIRALEEDNALLRERVLQLEEMLGKRQQAD